MYDASCRRISFFQSVKKSVALSLLFGSLEHSVYGEAAATSAGVANPSLIEIGPGLTVANHIVPVKKPWRFLLRHFLQR